MVSANSPVAHEGNNSTVFVAFYFKKLVLERSIVHTTKKGLAPLVVPRVANNKAKVDHLFTIAKPRLARNASTS